MPYLCTHQPASHVHKTPAYFYLLNSHTAHPERGSATFHWMFFYFSRCVSVIWNCGTISEHSRFGCNHLQLKFNEMETDTGFFSVDDKTHSTPYRWRFSMFERLHFLAFCIKSCPDRDPHTCSPNSSACIPAHRHWYFAYAQVSRHV